MNTKNIVKPRKDKMPDRDTTGGVKMTGAAIELRVTQTKAINVLNI